MSSADFYSALPGAGGPAIAGDVGFGTGTGNPYPGTIADPGASAGSQSIGGGGEGSGTSVGGGLMIGMAASSVIQAIGGIFISYWQKETQKIQMNAQFNSAVSRSNHTDAMAKKQKESQIARLSSQRNQQDIIAAGQKDMNTATRDRKVSEDNLIIARAEVREERRTEETWRRPSQALDNYFYGTPV